MARSPSRRADRVPVEKEPAAAASIRPASDPSGEAGKPAGVHWTWKVAMVIWAAAFVILLIYEWSGTLYRLRQ